MGLGLVVSMHSHAQDAEMKDELPGNTELPTSQKELKTVAEIEKGNYAYSVADYFEQPKTSSYQFSPDGNYFSYRKKDDKGKRHVYVQDIASGDTKKILEEGEELIRGYGWPNNKQLIYVKDKGGDENYQLFLVNVDGTMKRALHHLTEFEQALSRS